MQTILINRSRSLAAFFAFTIIMFWTNAGAAKDITPEDTIIDGARYQLSITPASPSTDQMRAFEILRDALRTATHGMVVYRTNAIQTFTQSQSETTAEGCVSVLRVNNPRLGIPTIEEELKRVIESFQETRGVVVDIVNSSAC